jgi:hypothetical protein
MSLKRVVSEVGLDGATVVLCTKERVALLGRTGVLFWIDYSDRKDLQHIFFREGERAWVYYAKVNQKVVSFVRDNGEKIEDLPKIDSVEV